MNDQFRQVLDQAIADTKIQLKADSQELGTYMAERALILSSLIGQPGYDQAVIAERDNVLLKAGILGVGQADGAQQRLIGIIQGAISLGAQALATL